jgi:hypothetical protein
MASAATVVAFVASAAVAPAHTHTFPSRFASLTVSEGSRSTLVEVHGQISSPRAACVKNRQVRAGFFNPASGLTSGIRSDTTNANGFFSIEVSRRSNLYKAQVEKKSLRSRRGHRHKCGLKVKTVEGP